MSRLNQANARLQASIERLERALEEHLQEDRRKAATSTAGAEDRQHIERTVASVAKRLDEAIERLDGVLES
jgi:hypothetical protein